MLIQTISHVSVLMTNIKNKRIIKPIITVKMHSSDGADLIIRKLARNKRVFFNPHPQQDESKKEHDFSSVLLMQVTVRK